LSCIDILVMQKEKEVIGKIKSIISDLKYVMDSSDIEKSISKITVVIDEYEKSNDLNLGELENQLIMENELRIKLSKHCDDGY